MTSAQQAKQAKKRKAYNKTHGICFICGYQVSENPAHWTLEHYIPRAIYKWVSIPNLKSQLESLDNLFITHDKCNLNKDSEVPTMQQIQALSIDEDIKTQLLNLYINIKPALEAYQTIKNNVLQQQNHHCFFCSKTVSYNRAVLRRKDNRQGRTENNAMCLCLECSIKTSNEKYKHDMVRKKLAQRAN